MLAKGAASWFDQRGPGLNLQAAQAKEAEYKAAGLAHLTADVEQVLQAAVAPDPLPLALPAPPGGGSREAPQAAAATPPLSRIRVELKAPELKRPSIGKVYAHGQLPVVVDDLAKQLPVPGNPLAGLSGMLREEDINHNAVMEAFSRLDSEIQGWGEHAEATGYGLLPVEEGAEEAEDYTDNTFLTGVAMEGNRGEAQEDAEVLEPSGGRD